MVQDAFLAASKIFLVILCGWDYADNYVKAFQDYLLPFTKDAHIPSWGTFSRKTHLYIQQSSQDTGLLKRISIL